MSSIYVDVTVDVRGEEPLTFEQAKETLVRLAIKLVDEKSLAELAQELVDASAARRPAARPRHRAKAGKA